MKLIKFFIMSIMLFNLNLSSKDNVLEIEINPKITMKAYNFSVNDNIIKKHVIKNLSKIKNLKYVPDSDFKFRYNKEKYKNKTKKEIANIISDNIYTKTYNKGKFFTKRITFIIKDNNNHKLVYSDYEGNSLKTVLISKQPILSPDIHEDLLTYVSFENYRPSIYLHNVKTNKRIKISNYKGINSSPKFNNNGKKIIFTLSRNGNLDIYEYSISENKIKQLTNTSYNELSPSYNDKGIIFSKETSYSNPKLFQLNKNQIKRISPLNYIVSSDYKNSTYVFLNKDNNHEIFIQENSINNKSIYKSKSIEKVSLSDNGEYIIFSEYLENNRILKVINKRGEVFYTLSIKNKDLIEPSF